MADYYRKYKYYFLKLYDEIYEEVEKNGEALRDITDVERAMGLDNACYQATVNGFK